MEPGGVGSEGKGGGGDRRIYTVNLPPGRQADLASHAHLHSFAPVRDFNSFFLLFLSRPFEFPAATRTRPARAADFKPSSFIRANAPSYTWPRRDGGGIAGVARNTGVDRSVAWHFEKRTVLKRAH